jgi:hypothetical protein
MAPKFVKLPLLPETVSVSRAVLAVVPPIAPAVSELDVPVELRVIEPKTSASMIEPTIEAAPAALVKVSDSSADELVMLPKSRPALSFAVATNVLV